MRFIFTKLFYLLIAASLILLSLSWGRPWLRWVVVAYDIALIALAIIDARRSQLPKGVRITREFSGRFAVGAETNVSINVQNAQPHAISLVDTHRKTSWRGEGREFESLRDYVRGDELRHISWSATARRGKLTTRQYQIERDQTILIAIDGGRLMTARIEQETKLDSAVHAALALMSAAARAG